MLADDTSTAGDSGPPGGARATLDRELRGAPMLLRMSIDPVYGESLAPFSRRVLYANARYDKLNKLPKGKAAGVALQQLLVNIYSVYESKVLGDKQDVDEGRPCDPLSVDLRDHFLYAPAYDQPGEKAGFVTLGADGLATTGPKKPAGARKSEPQPSPASSTPQSTVATCFSAVILRVAASTVAAAHKKLVDECCAPISGCRIFRYGLDEPNRRSQSYEVYDSPAAVQALLKSAMAEGSTISGGEKEVARVV